MDLSLRHQLLPEYKVLPSIITLVPILITVQAIHLCSFIPMRPQSNPSSSDHYNCNCRSLTLYRRHHHYRCDNKFQRHCPNHLRHRYPHLPPHGPHDYYHQSNNKPYNSSRGSRNNNKPYNSSRGSRNNNSPPSSNNNKPYNSSRASSNNNKPYNNSPPSSNNNKPYNNSPSFQQQQQPLQQQSPFQQQQQEQLLPPKYRSWFPSLPASSCPGTFQLTIDGLASLGSQHYKKSGYHQISLQITSIYGNNTVAGKMWIDKKSDKDTGIDFLVKDTFNNCQVVTSNSTTS